MPPIDRIQAVINCKSAFISFFSANMHTFLTFLQIFQQKNVKKKVMSRLWLGYGSVMARLCLGYFSVQEGLHLLRVEHRVG
jgi:hypothetical protein